MTDISGSEVFPCAGLLKCKLGRSMKREEALVHIQTISYPNPQSYYVDRILVRPSNFEDDEVPGEVEVTVLARQNGTAVVEVPGEPISAGPRIGVESQLLRT